MTNIHPVTIYTTHPRYGNIVRYQGDLQDYGCQPSQGTPSAAYVRFVPRGKMSPREILQATDPYILITEGYDGILTPDIFVVTATLTGLTTQVGPVCSDPHYIDHFERLIRPLIENGRTRVIADYRSPGRHAPLWPHTLPPPVQPAHCHAGHAG
jgi:hypothetical protein